MRYHPTTSPVQVEHRAMVALTPHSGKSVLALYRVQCLVATGRTPILFTTYTNALVGYSEQLLGGMCRRRMSGSTALPGAASARTSLARLRRS